MENYDIIEMNTPFSIAILNIFASMKNYYFVGVGTIYIFQREAYV